MMRPGRSTVGGIDQKWLRCPVGFYYVSSHITPCTPVLQHKSTTEDSDNAFHRVIPEDLAVFTDFSVITSVLH